MSKWQSRTSLIPETSLWTTLDRLQSALQLPDKDWLRHLQLTRNRYFWLRQHRKEPPAHSVASLCSLYDLSFREVIEGDIDFERLTEIIKKV